LATSLLATKDKFSVAVCIYQLLLLLPHLHMFTSATLHCNYSFSRHSSSQLV